jgi:archaellum component FlaC
MKPLYDLTNTYMQIAAQIDDSDSINEEHLFLIESITGDIKEKCINIGYIIQNFEADVDTLDVHIKKMQEKQLRLMNKINSLKSYVKNNLETCDIKRIESPYFNISIKINPASVKVQDESLVPSQYFKEIIKRNLDRKTISEDLKNNIFIPGVTLEKNTRLEIK